METVKDIAKLVIVLGACILSAIMLKDYNFNLDIADLMVINGALWFN